MKGERHVATAKNIAIDWTKYFSYSSIVEDEIGHYCNIQVTEDLREGGKHANKSWVYWFKYLTERVWKTHLGKEIKIVCEMIDNPRILSLGCGYGGIELDIAKSLNKPYEIIAVDINRHLFAEAIEKAKVKDLNITFIELDLNFVKIKENSFDVVYAHSSLHHLLNLEHVFFQVYKGLKKEGRFIILDIIGKNRVLFWKDNVDFATDVVSKMPSKYKAEAPNSSALKRPCVEPSVQAGLEGIRQEEIEGHVYKYFTPIKMFKYGSFMRMVCLDPIMGKLFDPDVKEDREYLEYLFDLDLKQVEGKKLRPTEIFAVFKKNSISQVIIKEIMSLVFSIMIQNNKNKIVPNLKEIWMILCEV